MERRIFSIIIIAFGLLIARDVCAKDVGSRNVRGTLNVEGASTLTTTLAHGDSASISAAEGVALNDGTVSGEGGFASRGFASGQWATALGFGSIASGFGSHADSLGNSSATDSHADSWATASGNYSHAGARGVASGVNSFALGFSALASGDFAGALGEYVSATHDDSFVFGNGVSTNSLVSSEVYEVVFGSRGVEAIQIHYDEVIINIPVNFNDILTIAGNVIVERLGVGTPTPAELVHLRTVDDSSVVRLERNDTDIVSGEGYGRLEWYGQDASPSASGVRGYLSLEGAGDDEGATDMVFGTAEDNVVPLEKMRLTFEGNLGINEPAPDSRLEVNGTFHATGDGLFNGDLTFASVSEFEDVSNEGLVLSLNYNTENISGTTVFDASAYGNHGVNDTVTLLPSGGFNGGGAVDFATVGHTIVADAVSLKPADAQTVSVWMYWNGSGSVSNAGWTWGINKMSDSSAIAGFMLGIRAAIGPAFLVSSEIASVGTTLNKGQWYHFVGTAVASGNAKLYIDGELVATSGGTLGGTLTQSSLDVHLGDPAYFSSDSSDIRMDGARMYNRALSSNEIKALYLQRSEFGGAYVSQSDITVDSSGNVGIDEVAPDSQLEVNGTFHATGAATLDSTLIFSAQGTSVNEFSIDGTLAGNSDDAVPTEKAVKTYVAANVGGTLDIDADTGTPGTVVVGTQTFTIVGTAEEVDTSVSGQTITVGLPSVVAITTDLSVGSDLGVGGGLRVGSTAAGDELAVIGYNPGNINTGNILVVANNVGDSHFMIAQDATHGLTGTWQYNATVANAKAYVNTFGYSNDLFIDGDDLFLQDASTGNARVGIGNNETFDGGAILQVGTGGADCDGTNWNDGCFERLKIGIVSASTTASWNLLDSLQPRKYQYRIREKVYHLWDGREVLSLDGITSVTTEIRRVMKPIEKYNRQVMEMGNDLSIVPRFEDILTTRPATMREMITSTTIRITDRGNGRDTYGLVWEELPEILRNPGGVNGTKIAAFNMSVLKQAKRKIERLENRVNRAENNIDALWAAFGIVIAGLVAVVGWARGGTKPTAILLERIESLQEQIDARNS